MILGLDAIKEGFGFRNKNFSLDDIGNRLVFRKEYFVI